MREGLWLGTGVVYACPWMPHDCSTRFGSIRARIASSDEAASVLGRGLSSSSGTAHAPELGLDHCAAHIATTGPSTRVSWRSRSAVGWKRMVRIAQAHDCVQAGRGVEGHRWAVTARLRTEYEAGDRLRRRQQVVEPRSGRPHTRAIWRRHRPARRARSRTPIAIARYTAHRAI